MKPEHVVSIILVAVAVVVVALFLIAIVVELRRTHLRLVTILGAVGETVEKTDPLETVVNEIRADLAAGQAALVDCVERLEQRLGPVGGPEEITPLQRPGDVFTQY
ncbi:MAG: hypothetical protein QOJ89_4555 [bacterium]|jgi:uncharacterized protein YoxC